MRPAPSATAPAVGTLIPSVGIDNPAATPAEYAATPAATAATPLATSLALPQVFFEIPSAPLLVGGTVYWPPPCAVTARAPVCASVCARAASAGDPAWATATAGASAAVIATTTMARPSRRLMAGPYLAPERCQRRRIAGPPDVVDGSGHGAKAVHEGAGFARQPRRSPQRLTRRSGIRRFAGLRADWHRPPPAPGMRRQRPGVNLARECGLDVPRPGNRVALTSTITPGKGGNPMPYHGG